MKSILLPGSALALFVASITGTDDPDLAVTFDDLAEFTSAFHRRSDFHFSFSCLVLKSVKSFNFQQLSFFTFLCCGLQTRKRCATILPFRKTVGTTVTRHKLSLSLSSGNCFIPVCGGIVPPENAERFPYST